MSTLEAARDQSFIARAMARHRSAVDELGPGSHLGHVRASLHDVPELLALAERGVADRALIQQHDGHEERAGRVRNLHGSDDLGGGLIVCTHCSVPGRVVEYPCPTLDALDG